MITEPVVPPIFCVVLAGCGAWDGSDIHETVLVELALHRAGVRIIYAAPDTEQLHVLNHLTHEELDGNRNVMVESARLARGDVVDLQTLSSADLDGLILPGGHGVIKNLSRFALNGPQGAVHSALQTLIIEMHQAGKPIGAVSTAPLVVARALQVKRPSVTIGTDPGTAAAIATMGGTHRLCDAHQIHRDCANRIVTTPGFMSDGSISQVAQGIENLVLAMVEMMARSI